MERRGATTGAADPERPNVSMTPTTGIVTPECVVLEFRTAGLATRSLAKLIDLLLMALMSVAVVLLALLGASTLGETAAVVVVSIGLFVTLLLVPAMVETRWNGVTPGKGALGLRVITVEGGPISFRHALVRGLLQLGELPTGAAMLVALSTPRSQRLGDLAAGTFVISERAALHNTVPVAFFPPPGLETYCASLDTSAVSSAQFLLVRNFLLRVADLDPQVRLALATRFADALRVTCSTQPPPSVTAEMFLICVASSYQIHHGGLPTLDEMAPGSAVPPAMMAAANR